MRLGQHALFVRGQIDGPVGDDDIGACVGKGKTGHVGFVKLYLRESGNLRIGAGLGDHGGRAVDSDDATPVADEQRCDTGIGSGPTAEIHDSRGKWGQTLIYGSLPQLLKGQHQFSLIRV